MGLNGAYADIYDYADLDEVEDLDGSVAAGRDVEATRLDDYDGLREGAEEYASHDAPEPTEAATSEASPGEDGSRDALPFEADVDALMREIPGSAFQDFDDIDEPEVEVIYNEAQIEEAAVDTPPAEADPGLEATLVLDRVADAVKKLRVEGESAPVAQVREQSSEAEIHTEFKVSEDDRERLEVVRRDVTSQKGSHGTGFFARIGAFVVKALHLDER